MKLLITGATGFIGQHLLDDDFFNNENPEIRILTRNVNPDLRSSRKVKICKGDLSEISTLEDAFSGTDIVINLAAELKDEDKFKSTNILGTENIIAMITKHKIKKLINLSSVGVVGMQYSHVPINVSENTECHPKNNYEISKLKSEHLFLEAAEQNNFKLVILRPTNVFGDFHPKFYLLNFMHHLKNKAFFYCKNAVVNYVYVKDVINAINYFVENNSDERILNIGSSTKLSEFAHTVNELLLIKPNTHRIPSGMINALEKINYAGIRSLKNKLRSVSNAVTYDDTKIKRIIGYKYGIEEGLKRTFNYYKTTGKL
jgi:nucleoside-diphosphate-sugar epimerase